jgi:hypothetical protein
MEEGARPAVCAAAADFLRIQLDSGFVLVARVAIGHDHVQVGACFGKGLADVHPHATVIAIEGP